MLMPDVNILVYAHRKDEAWHEAYASWLSAVIDGAEPFLLSVFVAVAFNREGASSRRRPTPLATTAPSVPRGS